MSDRVELRALVDEYAHCVDLRDGNSLSDLFTEDGVLLIPDTRRSLEPSILVRGRTAIREGLDVMRRFERTMHAVVGQVADVSGGRATGFVSCLAHHVRKGTDTVWFLRYHDTYVRGEGRWLFERRELWVDWIEERTVRQVRGDDGR